MAANFFEYPFFNQKLKSFCRYTLVITSVNGSFFFFWSFDPYKETRELQGGVAMRESLYK